MSKVYLKGEAIVSGEIIQTDKINQIINPETEKKVYEDVFEIEDYKEFENYKLKEDFLQLMYEMSIDYFSKFGEICSEITFMAADEETDIIKWGFDFEKLDEDNFQYAVMDYLSSDTVMKFA